MCSWGNSRNRTEVQFPDTICPICRAGIVGNPQPFTLHPSGMISWIILLRARTYSVTCYSFHFVRPSVYPSSTIISLELWARNHGWRTAEANLVTLAGLLTSIGSYAYRLDFFSKSKQFHTKKRKIQYWGHCNILKFLYEALFDIVSFLVFLHPWSTSLAMQDAEYLNKADISINYQLLWV